MNDMPERDNVIRITAADVASPHVDDLLSRQAALRGDTGISARRGRRWYYSNWFIFMLAAGLGAFVAWAVMEPFYDDWIYHQGTIEAVDPAPATFPLEIREQLEKTGYVQSIATVTVGGEDIVFFESTRVLDGGAPDELLDADVLQEGQEIGIHVDYVELPDQGGVGLAKYVDFDPPPQTAPPRELSQLAAEDMAVGFVVLPVVAAFIGLFIGSADGLVCRLTRRGLLCGGVGLIVGFLGAFFTSILANLVYTPLTMLAAQQSGEGPGGLSTLGFLTQVGGRSLAWMLAGMAMGLGQGIALRSGRLLLYGFLGGAIGGMLGGLLFDPINLTFSGDTPSGHLSRMVGFTVVGLSVGLMIGVVELLARDAWLQMVEGPLAGKEFLIFKDVINVGASPSSDIYLFNDEQVAARHAVIRAAADQYEIEALDSFHPVLLNGQAVPRGRLRHGDQITLGSTVFVFQRRRTD